MSIWVMTDHPCLNRVLPLRSQNLGIAVSPDARLDIHTHPYSHIPFLLRLSVVNWQNPVQECTSSESMAGLSPQCVETRAR